MDQGHNNTTRTLETKEFQERLIAHIMSEYDAQSFKDPLARWLVESLLRDGLSSRTDQQLRETAIKWFPDKFPL